MKGEQDSELALRQKQLFLVPAGICVETKRNLSTVPRL